MSFVEAQAGEIGALGTARPLSGVMLIRVVDVVIAALALAFLAPLILLLAALVHLQDGGPAIFAHRRIGKHGRTFDCLKLRSMRVDAEEQLDALLAADPEARQEWERDQKLRDDPRVTALGGFLRRSSLDETPQLVNVLRGEMSLVGPRPITPRERQRYGHWFSAYTNVNPGITGLWQVSGRNSTSYRRRIAIDVVYSRRRSLQMDLYIIAKTIPAVLARSGSC